MVRNPMNIHYVNRITLSPDVVDFIVFWTKNPERMMNRLHLLSAYNFYFQFTLNAYGQKLEPNVPSRDKVIMQFQALSKLIGKERVIWRYDPILLTETMNIDYHFRHFQDIASDLAGFTNRCVISFLDLYKKCVRNLLGIELISLTEHNVQEIARMLADIARKRGIRIVSCAEEMDLSEFGIDHGKCIDDKLISEISGREINIEKDKSQRKECGCVASIDIGAYNTCCHGCLYCYANYDSRLVKKNLSLHQSDSPLLSGGLGPKDRITEKKVISCFDLQETLFSKKRV